MPDTSLLANVTFRPFHGESDFPAMVDIFHAINRAGQVEGVMTIERLANEYTHLNNCDPATDVLMAEVASQLVGFARVWWWVNETGEWLYGVHGWVHPDWQRQGIGRALLDWQERRAREMAATHPAGEPRFFEAMAMEGEVSRVALLKHSGFVPIRFGIVMVRPNLDDLPEAPLPVGFEVRPVLFKHVRLVWEALDEVFRDHWGHRAGTEEDYQGFLNDREMQPRLWQVAWDTQTNQVAGMVLNRISEDENRDFDMKRGWTEPIGVRRPWRRRGLARALIIRSLNLLKEQGMTQAALSVDTDNPHQALRLYESCGYQAVKRFFALRKSL